MCLQVDVDLAKQHADKPEEDEELRKKLWLKIGKLSQWLYNPANSSYQRIILLTVTKCKCNISHF